MAIIGGDKKSIIGAATIAWEDAEKRDNIMWKVPRNIKMNDNIVVREDEYAVFYRDGKALDYIDRPDRYALTSMNAPIVGRIVEFLSGVRQDAEVYYLQKRVFDGKFGSKQPYVFRDKDFGMVNLRVFGEFRYKVAKPMNFINQFVGTFSYTSSSEVEDRIKEQLIMVLYDVLGDAKNKGLGVADLAANLTNLEQALLERCKSHFDLYGILIDKLSGLYINLPEEVQKAVDTRSSMGVLGTNYMQYQAGQAMREAAQNHVGRRGRCRRRRGRRPGHGLRYGRPDAAGHAAAPTAAATATAAGAGAGCGGRDAVPQVRRHRPGGLEVLPVLRRKTGGSQLLSQLRRAGAGGLEVLPVLRTKIRVNGCLSSGVTNVAPRYSSKPATGSSNVAIAAPSSSSTRAGPAFSTLCRSWSTGRTPRASSVAGPPGPAWPRTSTSWLTSSNTSRPTSRCISSGAM